jgi:hypothetical protein
MKSGLMGWVGVSPVEWVAGSAGPTSRSYTERPTARGTGGMQVVTGSA